MRSGCRCGTCGVEKRQRLRLKAKGNLQPGTGRRCVSTSICGWKDHPIGSSDGDQLPPEAGRLQP